MIYLPSKQEAELLKAAVNGLFHFTFENFLKFLTEGTKTQIEYSRFSDNEKEIFKSGIDSVHEYIVNEHIKAKLLYSQLPPICCYNDKLHQ